MGELFNYDDLLRGSRLEASGGKCPGGCGNPYRASDPAASAVAADINGIMI